LRTPAKSGATPSAEETPSCAKVWVVGSSVIRASGLANALANQPATQLASRRSEASRLCGRGSESPFRLRGDLREACSVFHGEIGEGLAINVRANRLEPVHQLAIGKAVEASSRADALDPKSAILALAIASIAICVAIGAIGRFLRGLIELALGKKKSLGAAQIFFASRAA